jgi:CDP-diacylglycerol--glycerol-3-phosphate 3-phosphatidyltransferase
MTFSDLDVAVGGFGLMAVAVGIYVVRSARKGRARHARTDADGGSVFLGKSVMEIGYWLVDPLVGGLAACRITPAAVTLFSLVPAVCAGVAIALGWFALAALFGAMAATCDLLDGLLARRLGVASDAGEVLDAAVDRTSEFLFLAGIAVYYRAIVPCLLLTLAALFGSFMVSYTTAKAEAMNVTPPRGSMRRPERAVYLLSGAALTAITKALWGDSNSISLVLREFPMIFSLFLVAAVTNVSTVMRLRAVIHNLRARDPAPREDVVQDIAGTQSKTPAGIV